MCSGRTRLFTAGHAQWCEELTTLDEQHTTLRWRAVASPETVVPIPGAAFHGYHSSLSMTSSDDGLTCSLTWQGCVSTEVEHSVHTKAVMESWFHDFLDALQGYLAFVGGRRSNSGRRWKNTAHSGLPTSRIAKQLSTCQSQGCRAPQPSSPMTAGMEAPKARISADFCRGVPSCLTTPFGSTPNPSGLAHAGSFASFARQSFDSARRPESHLRKSLDRILSQPLPGFLAAGESWAGGAAEGEGRCGRSRAAIGVTSEPGTPT